jgi:hypothetical protein
MNEALADFFREASFKLSKYAPGREVQNLNNVVEVYGKAVIDTDLDHLEGKLTEVTA